MKYLPILFYLACSQSPELKIKRIPMASFNHPDHIERISYTDVQGFTMRVRGSPSPYSPETDYRRKTKPA